MKKLALISTLAVLVIIGFLEFFRQESPSKSQSAPVPNVFINAHFDKTNSAWWTTFFEAKASAEVPITLTQKFYEDPDSREKMILGIKWTEEVFDVSPGKPEPVAFRIDGNNFFVQIYGNDDCKPGLSFSFVRIGSKVVVEIHNFTNMSLELRFPDDTHERLAIGNVYIYHGSAARGVFSADPCGDISPGVSNELIVTLTPSIIGFQSDS